VFEIVYLKEGAGYPCTGHTRGTIPPILVFFFIVSNSVSFALGAMLVCGSLKVKI